MNLKAFVALSLAFIAAPAIIAQTDGANEKQINLTFDVRADYTYADTEHQDSESGFHGRYLNMRLDGSINDKVTYSWRQRFNKFENVGSDVFAATDWVYVRYQPTDNFAFAGGKQVLLIGGYEYDAAPIDIYFASNFWNNIACYQFGASAEYISNDGKHSLTFQVCNSPYQSMNSSCYAYNLFWSGSLGLWRTLWSVNAVEYLKGHYANFIALGNRFDFHPKFNLELDLMNRAVAHHKFFGRDFSIIGKAEFNVTPWMTIMAKGGYDRISIDHLNDVMWPTTDLMLQKPFYGGGLEFYPMHGSRDLRLHILGYCGYNNDGVRTSTFNLGVKWRVNLINKK